MRSFLTALQFLTIIPAGKRRVDERHLPLAVACFPLVGLLIGLIFIPIVRILAVSGLNEMALSCIIVVILIVITGGLHLDGLADMFDALASGKPKDEMLAIMRDPHIGTMGVLALISILILKVSLLSCLSGSGKIIPIILMCVFSRWSIVMALSSFPYARSEGKAKIFIECARPKITALAALIAFVIAFAAVRLQGVAIFALVTAAAYLFMKSVVRKIDGITGDVLGALSELTEVTTLLFACVFKVGLL